MRLRHATAPTDPGPRWGGETRRPRPQRPGRQTLRLRGPGVTVPLFGDGAGEELTAPTAGAVSLFLVQRAVRTVLVQLGRLLYVVQGVCHLLALLLLSVGEARQVREFAEAVVSDTSEPPPESSDPPHAASKDPLAPTPVARLRGYLKISCWRRFALPWSGWKRCKSPPHYCECTARNLC